jgi:hypothetical protein
MTLRRCITPGGTTPGMQLARGGVAGVPLGVCSLELRALPQCTPGSSVGTPLQFGVWPGSARLHMLMFSLCQIAQSQSQCTAWPQLHAWMFFSQLPYVDESNDAVCHLDSPVLACWMWVSSVCLTLPTSASITNPLGPSSCQETAMHCHFSS